jgi:hypothetical protein
MESIRQFFASLRHRAIALRFCLRAKGSDVSWMVSPEQWNATAKRLEYLERQYLCDRLSREMDEDPSNEIPFTQEELIKRGLIDG